MSENNAEPTAGRPESRPEPTATGPTGVTPADATPAGKTSSGATATASDAGAPGRIAPGAGGSVPAVSRRDPADGTGAAGAVDGVMPDGVAADGVTADGGAADGGAADGGADGPTDIAAILNSPAWIRYLPAEHVKAAAKFTGAGAMIKSMNALQARLGEALFPPGEDAAPEAVARFYEKLGRPAEAAGYEPPALEGVRLDGGQLDTFRGWAHAAGLTQAQFADLVGRQMQAVREEQAAKDTAHAKAHAALAEDWGGEAEGRYELARRSAVVLFSDEQRRALGLAEDPRDWPAPFARALADIAPTFASHRHLARSDRDAGRSDRDLKAEAGRLRDAPDYWSDAGKQQRVAEIYEALYGTGPATGPGAV